MKECKFLLILAIFVIGTVYWAVSSAKYHENEFGRLDKELMLVQHNPALAEPIREKMSTHYKLAGRFYSFLDGFTFPLERNLTAQSDFVPSQEKFKSLQGKLEASIRKLQDEITQTPSDMEVCLLKKELLEERLKTAKLELMLYQQSQNGPLTSFLP